MPSNSIKIKISFDTAQGVADLHKLETESAKGLRVIAGNAKTTALATRDQAKATEIAASATASGARTSELMAKRLAAEAGERRNLALVTLREAQARNVNARAATEEEKSLSRRQEASRKADGQRSRGTGQVAAAAAQFGQGATLGVTLPIVAGAAAAIGYAQDLEQSLNVFQATAQATNAQMARVAQTARDLGADMTLPATSSTDAARAMTALAEKGLKVNDVMGASRGTMQLAAAATIDASLAAEIEGDALNAFHLQGTEATRIADMLAASQSASGTAITDAALAMQQSAAVFASAHQPVDSLITSVNLLGKAGVRGSDAGTSLKQMVLALETPSAKAAKVMQALGISIYDAQGKMLPFRDIIGQFTEKTAGLTQKQKDFALGTVFGSDAVRAANIVLAGGVQAYDKMHAAVTRQGAAAALAAAKNKGLKGAIDGLGSALQTVAEENATPFLHTLTEIVKKAGDAAEKLNALPEPVKEFGLGLAAVLAVAGPTAYGIGKVATMVVTLRSGLALLAAAKGAATIGEITTAAEGAALAETGAASAGTAAFAVGGAWTVAIVAAGALIWSLAGAWKHVKDAQHETLEDVLKHGLAGNDVDARKKAWDEIMAGRQYQSDHAAGGNPVLQATRNRSEASRILKSPEYLQSTALAASAKAQVASVRAGGPGAFTHPGESVATALHEYQYALKTAQANLAEALASKGKMEQDAHALRADANRLGRGGAEAGSAPSYVRAMMADSGKVIGLQCGEAISRYLYISGVTKSKTGGATAADTPANRVTPDARGNYPEGTIFRVGRIFHGEKTGDRSGSGEASYHRGHYEMLHYGPSGKPVTVEANYGIKKGVTDTRPFDMKREAAEATWGGAVHAYLPTAAMAAAWNKTHKNAAAQAGGSTGDSGNGGSTGNAALDALMNGDGSDSKAKKVAEDAAQARVAAQQGRIAALEAGIALVQSGLKDDVLTATGLREITGRLRGLYEERYKAAVQEAGDARSKKHLTDPKTAEADYAVALAAARRDRDAKNRDLTKLTGGSPREQAQVRLSIAANGQEGKIKALTAGVDDFRQKMDEAGSSTDKWYKGTVAGYQAIRAAQLERAQTERRAADLDAGGDPLKLRQNVQKQAEAGIEANREYDASLKEVVRRWQEIQAAAAAAGAEQVQQQAHVLDAQMQAATSEAARAALRERVRANQSDQINQTEYAEYAAAGKGAPSENAAAVKAAQDKATTARQVLFLSNQAEDQQRGQATDQGRAEFLRAEADAATDLAQKLFLLSQAQNIEAQAVSGTETAEQAQTRALRNAADTRAARSAVRLKDADDLFVSGVVNKQPQLLRGAQDTYYGLANAADPSQSAAGLSGLRDVLTERVKEGPRNGGLTPQQAKDILKKLLASLEASGLLTKDKAGEITGAEQDYAPRKGQSIGGTEFWDNMAREASQAGGNIVHAMLHPKKGQSIEKQFFDELASIGENALAGVVSTSLQNALTGGLKGVSGKSLFSGVDNLFKGVKGNLLQGAAGIYGAAMALGAGGKKKQKHSILGGILGFAAGSLLPGIGNLEGAEFGSALGGMFADGGRPPVGRTSIVGERGWEPFIPDGPGRILSHNDALRALSGAVMPPALTLQMPAAPALPRALTQVGTPGSGSGSPAGSGAGVTHVDMDVNYHNPVFHNDLDIDRANRKLARQMEKVLASG